MSQYIKKVWGGIERITRSFLTLFLGLLGKELSDKTFEALMQFVKFGIIGISNTVVSWGIYMVSLLMLKRAEIFPAVDYLIAQAIGFLLSVLWSFYWNNRFVFTLEKGVKRSFWKALLKTYISYSFSGLFLNSILLWIWIQIFGLSEYLAPILNLLISVPLNFIINKFWAFKKEG